MVGINPRRTLSNQQTISNNLLKINTMKRKVFLIAMAIMMVGATTTEAQNRPGKNFGNCPYGYNITSGNCPNQELLQELSAERDAFDKHLSQTDRTRISEIRTRLQSLQNQNLELRQQMIDDNNPPTLAQRQQMRVNRANIQDLRLEADEIADNYYDAIISILDNYRSATGNYGGRGISRQRGNGNCMGYGSGNGRNGNGYGAGRPMSGQGYGRGNGAGMRGMGPFTPTGFLLWDTSQSLPQTNENNANENAIGLFPNPATDNVQVFFDIDNDQKIIISITDRAGNLIWSSNELQANEGRFTHNINLKDFQSGIYFVKIDAGSHQWVRRLVVR
jgi:hypothetical protein